MRIPRPVSQEKKRRCGSRLAAIRTPNVLSTSTTWSTTEAETVGERRSATRTKVVTTAPPQRQAPSSLSESLLGLLSPGRFAGSGCREHEFSQLQTATVDESASGSSARQNSGQASNTATSMEITRQRIVAINPLRGPKSFKKFMLQRALAGVKLGCRLQGAHRGSQSWAIWPEESEPPLPSFSATVW